MIKLNLEPQFIKDGLTSKSGNDVTVNLNYLHKNSDHDCYSSYSCLYSKVIDLVRDNNYDKSNSIIYDDNMLLQNHEFGGVNTKKKNKHVLDEITQMEKKETKNGLLEIKKIGSEVLHDIIENHPYLYQSNNFNDNKVMELVYQLVKSKGYCINNMEYEFLIRYLRDNLFETVKLKLVQTHPLLAISDSSGIYIPTLRMGCDDSDSNIFNYNQKITVTQAISNNWKNFTTLFDTERRVDMSKNLIDPLFVLLFANKLPGFEDLVIHQDYSVMVEQLKNGEIDNEFLPLLFLRMSDYELLPSKNPEHLSLINNELLRIKIHMLLRELSYSIRKGNFSNKASCLLMQILSGIKMPNVKTEEENLIQTILATFSFKPTLITSANTTTRPTVSSLMTLNNSLLSNTQYNTPKAVYNIEYSPQDFYNFTQNEIPMFTDTNFSFLGFDPKTQKVIFTYSDKNTVPDKDNILLNIYQMLNTKKIEVDYNNIMSSVVTHSNQLENFYRDVKPVKLLLTNGMYIISIPREQRRYFCGPDTNIFFKTNIRPTINLSNIHVDMNVTVNKINYTLVGALCYDILKPDNFDIIPAPIMTVHERYKIGTFAIIKTGNEWIEYNPQDEITPERLTQKISRALRNNFVFSDDYKNINNEAENNNDVNRDEEAIIREEEAFKKWKDKEGKKVLEGIYNHKGNLLDMRISEEEAIVKINSQACLLFYSENYENYQSRIHDKLF